MACAFVRDCVCVVYTELCVMSVSYFVMLCGLRVASLCGCYVCCVCLCVVYANLFVGCCLCIVV